MLPKTAISAIARALEPRETGNSNLPTLSPLVTCLDQLRYTHLYLVICIRTNFNYFRVST